MKRLISIILLAFLMPALSFSKDDVALVVKVSDSATSAPLIGAVVQVKPYGLWSTTDTNGLATIARVPEGDCTIEVGVLGYETKTLAEKVSYRNCSFSFALRETSLALDDVVVVAVGSKSGEATASTIGRQAIDHLQATSLSDLLQLLPGNIVSSNPSLTAQSSFTNRTLDKYDSNNSFGASVIVDGVPISTNADMNTKGGTFSTAGTGVDMRSIGTDDIESVQVIRGIASAEYGDMSSGAMMITSKIGVSDLKLKAKVFPGVTQFYAGKGMKLGNSGTLNVNADFASGKTDPRYRSDIYNRVTANVIHSVNVGGCSTFTTKLSTTNVKDWSGPDPDEVIQDVYDQTKENGITLSHSGKFSTDKLFARTLKYDISASYKLTDSYSRKLVTGNVPLYDQKAQGTAYALMLPLQYYGCGGTIGKPVNVYAKVSDTFNLNTKDAFFRNRFNLGAEYRMDGNLGRGYYNEDNSLPLSTAGYRSRAFYDIPFLHQIVAYAEDNMDLKLSKTSDYPHIKAQLGARWNMIQPGQERQMSSLSPRINIDLEAFKWLSIRGGYGLSEKTPSLLMMYPDVKYYDIKNVDCLKGTRYLGVYTTSIIDMTPRALSPMKTEKFELGLDIRTAAGQNFSIVAYQENTKDGFSSTNDEWISISFPKWYASDVKDVNGTLEYEKDNPSAIDTTLVQISRTANQDVHISKGIEFDFNLGKIRSTGTSFYFRGAYTQTEYYSSNDSYCLPRFSNPAYPKVYFIYPSSAKTNISKRFNTSLMVVQSIPSLNFVVSATLQSTFYDYSMNRNDATAPIAYIDVAKGTQAIPISREELSDAENVNIHGYKLSDNIYVPGAYSGLAETWPTLWSANLRVTKDVSKFLGLSFYVNNLLFSQPWQSSSISTSKVERNGNYFSFGFEIYLNL